MLQDAALVKAGEDAAERLWKPVINAPRGADLDAKTTVYAAMFACTVYKHVKGILGQSALCDRVAAEAKEILIKFNAKDAAQTQIPPPDLFADPYFLRQFLTDAEVELERQRQAE
jgi:hypothetical protein